MAPKPKEVFVIQANEQPVAVFRDYPAAQEYMAGLSEQSPETVHGLFTVRLYEYSVGRQTNNSGEFTLRSDTRQLRAELMK